MHKPFQPRNKYPDDTYRKLESETMMFMVAIFLSLLLTKAC